MDVLIARKTEEGQSDGSAEFYHHIAAIAPNRIDVKSRDTGLGLLELNMRSCALDDRSGIKSRRLPRPAGVVLLQINRLGASQRGRIGHREQLSVLEECIACIRHNSECKQAHAEQANAKNDRAAVICVSNERTSH